MRIDGKGWLVAEECGAQIVRVPSKRCGAMDKGGPFGICWHWTGADFGALTDLALVQSIAKPLKPGEEAKSWNLMISREGVLYQSISLLKRSWHVRKAAPGGGPIFVRGAVNHASHRLVGVELENLGELRLVHDHWIGWPWVAGRSPVCHDSASVVEYFDPRHGDADPVFYQGFTEAQVNAAREFVEAAHAWRPGWLREAFEYGHRDFDPGRRSDPGPVWARELAVILDGVLGVTRSVF